MFITVKSKSQKNICTFTLIELLIVIAILSILFCLLLPGLKTAVNTSKKIACVSHEKQIYLAWLGYSSEWNHLPYCSTGYLLGDPWGATKPWTYVMRDYLKGAFRDNSLNCLIADRGILSCPLAPNTVWFGMSQPDYGMNLTGIGGLVWTSKRYVTLAQIALPSLQFAFADTTFYYSGAQTGLGQYTFDYSGGGLGFGHNGKVNMLFCDGHVAGADRSILNKPAGWDNKAPWGSP